MRFYATMLTINDPTAVEPLLAALPYDLVPHAIVAGMARGHVFADDASRPRAALVWDGGWDVFLTGDPASPDAIAVASRALAEVLLPRARAAGQPGLLVFPSPAWIGDPVAAVLPGQRLVAAKHMLFTDVGEPRSALPALPPGFALALVDGAFMARADLRHAESLRQWLYDCWLSPDVFAAHGFGICVLRGDEVVSWCMAEYVGRGRCGIGIETTEGYRRRGFATLAAAEFVRAARERDLAPHWECLANNEGSVATALKVGFTGRVDYDVYWVPL